jgi:hypothetical protein
VNDLVLPTLVVADDQIDGRWFARLDVGLDAAEGS